MAYTDSAMPQTAPPPNGAVVPYTDDPRGDTSEDNVPGGEQGIGRLSAIARIPNLALTMDLTKLGNIGTKVCRETQIDITSRTEWDKRTRAGMDLALQNAKPKNFPWPNAANVRFPLMTSAAVQFAARAYPAIVSGSDVVRTQITGEDPDGKKKARGERIAHHMSWQLLNEMKEWEPDVDRMLHALPIIGCAFKKTYFDADLGRARSDYVSAFDLIVNNGAKSLASAPRITHKFQLYPYQIQERFLSGVFRKFEYGTPSGGSGDEDAPHEFYEQHRRLELDGDGYSEPYIVTVHVQSQQVCRIRANWDADGIRLQSGGRIIAIDPIQYFTKIPFIPNPDGGFYEIGFAWLLSPLNEAINTVINQLLDAGTLANTGGGFIGSGLRLKGGTVRFSPGEYKEVDVSGTTARENVVPLTFPGPSPVLFQLLGQLIEAGREVASVKDVLTGEVHAQTMQSGTAMALIEQGLKVFTSIYKRIHRGLREEFNKLYQINRRYFDPEEYMMFTDAPDVADNDYQGDPTDIVPVSDPSMVADMQRAARAEFLGKYIGMPGMDPMAIVKRQLDAVGIENISELFAKQQPPNPEALAKLAELSSQIDKTNSEIELNRAHTVEALARADAEDMGQQLEAYRAFYEAMTAMKPPTSGGGESGASAQPSGPFPHPQGPALPAPLGPEPAPAAPQ